MEATDPPRSTHLTIMTLKAPYDFSVVKDMVVDVAVTIEEAEDGLLRTLTGLISSPSLELLRLRNANETIGGTLLQMRQYGPSCLQAPGPKGQGSSRHAQQAKMMVVWLLSR
jgi:hypothetical protein